MKLSYKQKVNAELSLQSLSEKAQECYSSTDPLDIYEVETDEGVVYFVRGCLGNYDGMTFEQLDSFLVNWQEEFENS